MSKTSVASALDTVARLCHRAELAGAPVGPFIFYPGDLPLVAITPADRVAPSHLAEVLGLALVEDRTGFSGVESYRAVIDGVEIHLYDHTS